MPSESFIKPAERVAGFKPYFFAQLAKKFAEIRQKGISIIRLDIGSPDLPPPNFIIDAMVKESYKPDVHAYSAAGGALSFRQAAATYYKNRFSVDVDAASEVVALIGSKEGLFDLAVCILNPGDTVIIPNPGYPVYLAGAKMAQANVYLMDLLPENNYLPDFDAIPAEVASKAKLMWLNYPNNPVGAIAEYNFYEKAVAYCREHNILLAHDAPYCDIAFDGHVPPSVLQVPGAAEVAVEFNSLSKTYNMAGWRLAYAIGNAEVIRLLGTYKSQVDSSTFSPLMHAGEVAMTGDQNWLVERNAIYKERIDFAVNALNIMGLKTEAPKAAFYLWPRIPQGFENSAEFCETLLYDTGISTTPGSNFGSNGEGFFRISLGQDTELVKKAMNLMRDWLSRR